MAPVANQKEMTKSKTIGILCCLLLCTVCFAQGSRLIVDQSGKGNFTSVQAAINSLPDSAATPRTIFIKKGTYTEKI